MATARVDERGAHAAFALLQRVVCPALEWDLRAAAATATPAHQQRLDAEIWRTLEAIAGGPLPEDAYHLVAAMPADLGGLALRGPGRPHAAAAARWAALTAALPEAKRLAIELDADCDWTYADQ